MTTATENLIDICDVPGAALDVGVCRWAPDVAAANLHFLMELGATCGRLSENGIGGFSDNGNAESGWLRVREVDAPVLAGIERRMQRMYPAWRLDSAEAVSIHDRITVHFNTAQARWLREHGRWP
jgi:hypothetical protein